VPGPGSSKAGMRRGHATGPRPRSDGANVQGVAGRSWSGRARAERECNWPEARAAARLGVSRSVRRASSRGSRDAAGG
jgi:hypothetical protein